MEVTLSAGDLVLFSRPCASMTLSPALICFGAKLFAGSMFDHVGLVVEHPETSQLLILEANVSGVSLRPLSDRLARTKSRRMSVRKLYHHQDSRDFIRRLWSISQEYSDYKYNTSMEVNIRAVIESHLHHITHKHHLDRSRYSYTLRVLQNELQHTHPLLQPLLRLRYRQLQGRLEMLNGNDSLERISIDDIQRTNCSQLVAHIYSQLGVLTPSREVLHFIPSDFSSMNFTHALPLEEGFALSPNIPVDMDPLDVPQAHSKARQRTSSPSAKGLLYFNEGNELPIDSPSGVKVKHGRVHVLDEHYRVVAELSDRSTGNTPFVIEKGHTLHAHRRTALEVLPSKEAQTAYRLAPAMSLFVQREVLAGIDTAMSGIFTEVGHHPMKFNRLLSQL